MDEHAKTQRLQIIWLYVLLACHRVSKFDLPPLDYYTTQTYLKEGWFAWNSIALVWCNYIYASKKSKCAKINWTTQQ